MIQPRTVVRKSSSSLEFSVLRYGKAAREPWHFVVWYEFRHALSGFVTLPPRLSQGGGSSLHKRYVPNTRLRPTNLASFGSVKGSRKLEQGEKVEWCTPAVGFFDKMSMLYKYRAFSDQSLSILIDAEVFCAAPQTLNDPFDSQIDVKSSLMAALEWVLKGEPKYPGSYQDALEMLLSGDADAMVERALNAGICSLSTSRDNTLMWSHYADQHRGFCIGIDPYLIGSNGGMNSHFPDHVGPMPVTYTNGNPMLPRMKMMNSSGYAYISSNHAKSNEPPAGNVIYHAAEAALCTKYLAWSYESEVRFIHSEGQNVVPIRPESIQEVIFGCRMPDRQRKTLKKLVSSCGLNNVRFFEMQKSETDLSFTVVACD